MRSHAVTLKLAALLPLLLLVAACNVFLENPDCFEKHIKDAVELYEDRKPRYARLSDGQTNREFFILTTLQRLNTWKARSFDRRARALRERGLPHLGCAEFVDMTETPPFRPVQLPGSNEKFLELDVAATRDRLQHLLSQKRFQDLAETAAREIQGLKASPRYHCLLRHFLESIERAADLAPRYTRKAKSLGLPSADAESLALEAETWSVDFIKLHLDVLSLSHYLDKRVSRFQQTGLPLFCQDLPFIPRSGALPGL